MQVAKTNPLSAIVGRFTYSRKIVGNKKSTNAIRISDNPVCKEQTPNAKNTKISGFKPTPFSCFDDSLSHNENDSSRGFSSKTNHLKKEAQ